ncbi:tumor necrosis factor-like [Chiloscyllium punctatum]|uniref:tumor necrosis factor-like n=1 Tax=Chiloscyllium punctatum TaxID=137246 RepID=UPI003B6338DF
MEKLESGNWETLGAAECGKTGIWEQGKVRIRQNGRNWDPGNMEKLRSGETLNSTPAPGQKMENYSAVTGFPVRNALQTKGGTVIWQNESDSTFTEGLEFRDNHLIIKRPGQYFVYTQVVFHSMECQPQAVYLSHELSKLSPSYPEEAILLKATKSACHSHQRKEPWYKTSYQGAIFEFLEGDQIFSRVNEETTGYVDTAEGKTFFGIFAV